MTKKTLILIGVIFLLGNAYGVTVANATRQEKVLACVSPLPEVTLTTVPYSPTPVIEATPSATVSPTSPITTLLLTPTGLVATVTPVPTNVVPNSAPYTGRAE